MCYNITILDWGGSMNEAKLRERITIFRILGKHIEKYINLFIVIMSLALLGSIGLVIYWFIDNSSSSSLSDNTYLASYIYVSIINLVGLIVLILNKKKKISSLGLSAWLHTHVLLMFIYGVVLSILDLDYGVAPTGFLMIAIIQGGILVVEPYYFGILMVGCTITIMGFDAHYNYAYFNGAGEKINFIALVVIIIVLAYRSYHSIVREYKGKARLEQLTYYDDLTGLLNERSYMLEIDRINKELSSGNNVDFGLVVMDVNNLKVTNDTYGHRFGCHLIVRCGHILPTIFKTSKCFHVGGDEFIVILYGDDLKNYKNVISEFDNTLRYSHITYEDVDLIFSVARGYAIFNGGKDYRETFNKADKAMYDNKKAIKEEYNLVGR